MNVVDLERIYERFPDLLDTLASIPEDHKPMTYITVIVTRDVDGMDHSWTSEYYENAVSFAQMSMLVYDTERILTKLKSIDFQGGGDGETEV